MNFKLYFFLFLSGILFLCCSHQKPPIVDLLTSKCDVLDSIEYDMTNNGLFMVKTNGLFMAQNLPRYDKPNLERFCNYYGYFFGIDTAIIRCGWIKQSNELTAIKSKCAFDTTYIQNAVLKFNRQIAQVTQSCGFTLLLYHNQKILRKKHVCCIEMFKDNRLIDLFCCEPKYKEETINRCRERDWRARCYNINKNWFLIEYSKDIEDLYN